MRKKGRERRGTEAEEGEGWREREHGKIGRGGGSREGEVEGDILLLPRG